MNSCDLRAATLSRFSSWGLNANANLPLLESVADLQPKGPKDVAARVVAAGYVAALWFSAPTEKIKSSLDRFELWTHLSSEEQDFVSRSTLRYQSTGFHSWLIESIQFMAWALGIVALDHFAPCADTLASRIPKAGSVPSHFISNAQLRPLDELLQEADTLYLLHWLAVEANLTGQAHERVVLPRISFRRHAADWIIGTADAWDDVSLDT